MSLKEVRIKLYGSEQPCPSCLHSPSSKETFEWLKAALTRKYININQSITIDYIDIDQPPLEDDPYVELIRNGDIFYPAVVINGVLVGEGNPQLKTIFAELEKLGYIAN